MDTTLSGHFIRCNVHFKRGLTDSERGRQLLDGLMQVFHKLLIATTISGRGGGFHRGRPLKKRKYSVRRKRPFRCQGSEVRVVRLPPSVRSSNNQTIPWSSSLPFNTDFFH